MDSRLKWGRSPTNRSCARCWEYIDIARKDGAQLAYGGQQDPKLGGMFVQPTIFTGVHNQMRIAREEVFGPILSRDQVRGRGARGRNRQRHAGSALPPRSGRRTSIAVIACAHRLRAGTVWINAYRVVSFATPFGGFKESGLGRENGMDSIRDFTETKSVYVELSGEPRDPFKLG